MFSKKHVQSGTNLLAKRGEVRRICLPSRGRSPRDGRQILLTSPSFARRFIRLLGWRSGPSVKSHDFGRYGGATWRHRPQFDPLAVRSTKTSTLKGHRNTLRSTGTTRPALKSGQTSPPEDIQEVLPSWPDFSHHSKSLLRICPHA